MRTSPPTARRGGRWFADRPVGVRILSSVAVASLTAAAVGFVALNDLGDLRDARNAELRSAMPYMNSLNAIGLTAKATANDERGFLLTGDPEFLTGIDERLEKIDGLFGDAHAAATSAEETAALDELDGAIDTWAESIRAEFALFRTDRQAAVAQAMGTSRELRKIYEDQLDAELAAAEDKLMTGAGYEQRVTAATRTILVLSIVGIGLAVLLGVIVTRSVTRPLTRLRENAARLAVGDLTQRTGVDQRDELGRTAASLDEAQNNLREVMASVVASADAVAASSEELSASSAQISAGAEETSAQSSVVSGAAEEVSRSVETVAAGAEQMGASIREIASNAAEASEVAARAVTAAETTTATVAKL
ncbi:methyl-accepting chemotaxis protein, partial [Blastococcus sp. SYSU DS0552]